MSRTKPIYVVAALLLLAVSSTAPQAIPVPQENSRLHVAVDLVLLDVGVQDKNGQPVRDLKQEDFRVYEDKVEQSITSFNTEESPVTWGLVLDRSSSMRSMIDDVYAAAINVIDQGTKKDEMFILTFNNTTDLVAELTSDRRSLLNSIFGLRAEGNTALYDAIDSALDYIKKGKHRKKVLVVVTDGGDNRSQTRFKHIVDRAKESDVLIYTVGMFGLMTHNPTEARATSNVRHELKELADTTGAYAHFPLDAEKCREAMDKIAREVSEHYTLGYYSSNQTRDGGWRKLKVAIAGASGGHYVVRTRTGYYAPSPLGQAVSFQRTTLSATVE